MAFVLAGLNNNNDNNEDDVYSEWYLYIESSLGSLEWMYVGKNQWWANPNHDL